MSSPEQERLSQAMLVIEQLLATVVYHSRAWLFLRSIHQKLYERTK